MFGVFRVKNHDFIPNNHIFSNFRGGGRQVRPPPLDPHVAIYKIVRAHLTFSETSAMDHGVHNYFRTQIAKRTPL
jgi:hypothetical protein